MSVFKTAYQTTVCRNHVLTKVIDSLREAYVRGDVAEYISSGLFTIEKDELRPMVLTSGTTPQFGHPLLVDRLSSTEREKQYLFGDIRPFISLDGKVGGSEDFTIKNSPEYKLMMARIALNQIWLDDSPSRLQNMSAVPMMVYASWISENVSRRYALDAGDQLTLQILAAFFYQSLFMDKDTFDEDDKLRFTSVASRNMKISGKQIIDVLDKIDTMSSIADYCRLASAITNNPRMEDFNVGVLVTIIGSTWFGDNAKENLGVALEHPPTWIAILGNAFNERTYKNSGIARITERYTGSKGGSDFLRSFISNVQLVWTGK